MEMFDEAHPNHPKAAAYLRDHPGPDLRDPEALRADYIAYRAIWLAEDAGAIFKTIMDD